MTFSSVSVFIVFFRLLHWLGLYLIVRMQLVSVPQTRRNWRQTRSSNVLPLPGQSISSLHLDLPLVSVPHAAGLRGGEGDGAGKVGCR